MIGLVACSNRKLSASVEAKDLYVSPLFLKSRRYVESRCSQWFILSAHYRLLDPCRVVAPYNITLNKMTINERRVWSQEVLDCLLSFLATPSTVMIPAGFKYRQFLVPSLIGRGHKVIVPMTGMGIGKQLQWLNRQ